MSGRRKHKEEEENQERWLLTYADMITLLVAFFMMMYSMSILNLEKFKKAAIGIRSGFNGRIMGQKESGESLVEKSDQKPVRPEMVVLMEPPAQASNQKTPVPTTDNRILAVRPGIPNIAGVPNRAERVRELVSKIKQSLLPLKQEGILARVVGEKKGVAIDLIGDMIFFPQQSAQLSPEAKKILNMVGTILNKMPNDLCIEGHTSHYDAAKNQQFANSWELSTARAIAVVNYLLGENQIRPERVSVMGYGQFRPPNENERTKSGSPIANNDRVRVFVYQE